jgi:preprotein translocase subunit SecG
LSGLSNESVNKNIMTAILVTIHVIVCVALIMIVLLQTGKGADMGAAFGSGGSNTLFGTTGGTSFLSKATTAAAIIFMLTSLCLAYVSSDRRGSSIMKDAGKAEVEQTQPADKPAAGEKKAEAQTETTTVVTVPLQGGTSAGANPAPAEGDAKPAVAGDNAAPAPGGDAKPAAGGDNSAPASPKKSQ